MFDSTPLQQLLESSEAASILSKPSCHPHFLKLPSSGISNYYAVRCIPAARAAQPGVCVFQSYIRCLAGRAPSTFLGVQGVVLAATFAVSHNVAEAKPLASGSATTSSLLTDYQERDWGIQQVCPAPPPTQPRRQHAANVAFLHS